MTSVEFPARDVARVAKLSLPFPKGDMRGRIAREGTREHNMLPLILLQQEIKRKGRREEGRREAGAEPAARATDSLAELENLFSSSLYLSPSLSALQQRLPDPSLARECDSLDAKQGEKEANRGRETVRRLSSVIFG